MSLKRQSEILNAVRQHGSCSITDLADTLSVSTETIRRNIQPLIEKGSVLRFHGGIMIPEQLDEPPFQRRMQVNRDAKRTIAAMVREWPGRPASIVPATALSATLTRRCTPSCRSSRSSSRSCSSS